MHVCARVISSTLSSVRPRPVLHHGKHSNRRGHRDNGEPITHQCVWSEQTADAHTWACTQTRRAVSERALAPSFSSKLISFGRTAKVASPLFNLHACQRRRTFMCISFVSFLAELVSKSAGIWGKRGRRCRPPSWKGGGNDDGYKHMWQATWDLSAPL